MNFFQKIVESIYSPTFYQQVLQQSVKSAIGFFALLVLFLTVIQTGIFYFQGINKVQDSVQKVVADIVTQYPDELEITIKDGMAATNVEEPYFIPLNVLDKSTTTEGNLLVIDTQTPFSVTEFKKYKAPMWLTKDALFILNESEIRSVDLTEIDNFTLNQSVLSGFYKEITPWFNWITPILTATVFIFVYIGFFLRLIYLFLLALLILLITKIMKKPVSYGQAYKVGIYAMVPAFFVDIVGLFFPHIHFPFLFTIITLVVVFVNFSGAQPTIAKVAKPKKK